MPDVLGYRGKWGVLAPSTNTVVEPDFYYMAPAGITLHAGRIFIADQNIRNDDEFEALMVQIRASLARAIADVKTAEPDYLIMGMSSETFWGGKQGNAEFTRKVEDLAGTRVCTGADACNRALQQLGARKLGIITPYQPVGDGQVRRYFEDCEYEIVALKGLKCKSAIDIAMQTEDTLRNAILEVNRPDVECIIQVGTNLSMVRLADEATRWLGKPVLAINAAIFWWALRDNGITDQRRGFGPLLERF